MLKGETEEQEEEEEGEEDVEEEEEAGQLLEKMQPLPMRNFPSQASLGLLQLSTEVMHVVC